MQARQKLETQYQENKIVLDELEEIKKKKKEDEKLPTIYKQTGSILLPVDFAESEQNVNKRIEFIQTEIARVEEKIKDINSSLEKTRDAILKSRAAGAPITAK